MPSGLVVSLAQWPRETPSKTSQKINRVLINVDLCPSTISSNSAFDPLVALAAIMVRIEKARSASLTDKVPSAESFLPVNGNTSGPRWHWQLIFTRQT